MRRDRALLERLEEAPPDDREAVLRLFTFEPPGITLGHAQRPERVLDLERCRGAGVVWAVRPTGGRAIFHDREWTYSLAARIDDPDWGGGLSEAYARASRLIHGALVRLGIPARLASHAGGAQERSRPGFAGASRGVRAGEGPSPHDRSAACFASTARHEIVLEGRKLVGSAQRRTRVSLLQQGSILIGPGHERLADFLAADHAQSERARSALRAAAHAAAFVPAGASLETLASAIVLQGEGRVRKIDGAPAPFLLTTPKTAPYTPPFTQSAC